MLVAGVDEVGRGSLAGPLIAVAALFDIPSDSWLMPSPIHGVKDSKKFSNEEKREEVYHRILNDIRLVDFGVGHATVELINKHGIEASNMWAMNSALEKLQLIPMRILVDGNKRIPYWSNQIVQPKFDDLCWPVGAASIIAKVIRDWHMKELSEDFPAYDWANNKGYGSARHKAALKTHGATSYHRSLFIRELI